MSADPYEELAKIISNLSLREVEVENLKRIKYDEIHILLEQIYEKDSSSLVY